MTYLIRELCHSHTITHLVLGRVLGAGNPTIVLADHHNVYICIFLFNSIQLLYSFNLHDGERKEQQVVQLLETPQSHKLFVLTSTLQLIAVELNDKGKLVTRKIQFMPGGDTLIGPVALKTPLMISNDKYMVVHSHDRTLVVIDLNTFAYSVSSIQERSVLILSYASDNRFHIIGRDSSFRYSLRLYKITGNPDEPLQVVKSYNLFKDRPTLTLALPENNCLLVLCGTTHYLYPFYGHTISKKTTDNSVKLTRVSVFKQFDDVDHDFVSLCLVDESRVLLVTESAELYLIHLQISLADQRVQLESWDLLKLGSLENGIAKLTHIGSGVFVAYGPLTQSYIFRVNSTEPYIETVKGLRVHDLFLKDPKYCNVAERSIEIVAPVVQIEKIDLAGLNLLVKLQPTLTHTYITMKYPQYLQPDRKLESEILRNVNYLSSPKESLILSGDGSKLYLSDIEHGRTTEIDIGQTVLNCKYVDGILFILSATSFIKIEGLKKISETNHGLKINLSTISNHTVAIVTADSKLVTLDLHTGDIRQCPPNGKFMSCISSNDDDIAIGHQDGSLAIGDLEFQVSDLPLKQILYKEGYIVAVDSNYQLHKVTLVDHSIRKYNLGCGPFEIHDCSRPDKFLFVTNDLLSMGSFNDSDDLNTSLFKLGSSVPQYFTVTNGSFIYLAENGELKMASISKAPFIKPCKLQLKGVVRRILILKVDKKIPIIILASENSLEMIDLETFKIIESRSLSEDDEIVGLCPINSELHVEEIENLNLTEQDLSFIRSELNENGFMIKVRCNDLMKVMLFTIGGDMKFNFHYLMKFNRLGSSLTYDGDLLMNLSGVVLSLGHYSTAFKISINQKFELLTGRIDIDENNYVENSLFEMRDLGSGGELRDFATGFVALEDNVFIVVDGFKTLKCFSIDLRSKSDKIKIKSLKLDFHCEYFITLLESVEEARLIIADSSQNVCVYKYSIGSAKVELKVLFKLNLQKTVRCIKSLGLTDKAHLCLLGCSDGTVFLLEEVVGLNGEALTELVQYKLKQVKKNNYFINSDPELLLELDLDNGGELGFLLIPHSLESQHKILQFILNCDNIYV